MKLNNSSENIWKKIFIASIFVLMLSITVFLQLAKKPYVADQNEIKANIEVVNCNDEARLEAVKKLFIKMGALEQDLNVETFEKVDNLVVTVKGKSDQTVIVGAHYDKVSEGCGVIDNWSGVVILANLYRTMKDISTEKTYKFVAFGKEEKGLVGSGEMAKSVAKSSISNYCAMINFDSFGFNYPQVLENASTKKMIDQANFVAKGMEIPFGKASLVGVADADSTSFKRMGIPAITFHGLSDKWREYLHSSNDNPENIDSNSVYIGYQFALRFLIKIDSAQCGEFR